MLTKPCNIKICDEMIKLREYLSSRNMVWRDSSDGGAWWICRTLFIGPDNKTWSAINGHGTLGGISSSSRMGYNHGLIELFSEDITPIGFMTADDVIAKIEGEENLIHGWKSNKWAKCI